MFLHTSPCTPAKSSSAITVSHAGQFIFDLPFSRSLPPAATHQLKRPRRAAGPVVFSNPDL